MNELDACIMNDLLGIDQTGHVFNDFLFFTNATARHVASCKMRGRRVDLVPAGRTNPCLVNSTLEGTAVPLSAACILQTVILAKQSTNYHPLSTVYCLL